MIKPSTLSQRATPDRFVSSVVALVLTALLISVDSALSPQRAGLLFAPSAWDLLPGALVSPVNLLFAGLAGWWLKKPKQLLGSLAALAFILAFGLSAVNFEALGAMPLRGEIFARISACFLAGGLFDLIQSLFFPRRVRL